MDRSPILEYVLPEQGWQSLVHVLWLSDADCDAVAVYGISQGVSEAEYGVFQVALRTAGYSPHGGWPVEHLVGDEPLRPSFG